MLDAPYCDFDQLLNSLLIDPVIANDIPIVTDEDREHLNNLLLTKYNGDTLSNAPVCQCGHLTGMENVSKVCEICGDVCETALNRPVYPIVWLKTPKDIKRFLNPAVVIPLSKIMQTDGCSDLMWLIDRSYVPPNGRVSVRCRRLEEKGVQRGLNYFTENYVEIFRLYSEAWVTRQVNAQKETFKEYAEMLSRSPRQFFSEYLPMPSRTGFVLESNDTGSYLERYIPQAIDALMIIVSINNAATPMGEKGQERRVIKAIMKLAPFYHTYVQKITGGKYGLVRKNVIASKMNFSARSTIISNTDPHRYDELHVPWTLALSLFRINIINRLLHRRFTPKQLFKLLTVSAKSYDPLLSEILDELIQLAGPKGIPVLFQRNPSLKRLSMVYFYITLFFKNPRINSTRISVLSIKGMNADFDGDQLNKYYPVDNNLKRRYKRFELHNGFLELKEPWQISEDMRYPSAMARLLTNWVLDGEHAMQER